MKRALIILLPLVLIIACTKSTIKKHGCSEPALSGTICLPNIFTPNGDGINDTLFIRESNGLPQVDSLIFKVLDATGSILFYGSDVKNGWDGTYNGKKKAGVYSCEISAWMSNGQLIEFSGTVTCLPDNPNDYIISQCADCRFDSQFDGQGGFDPTLPTGEPSDICE